MNGDWPPTIWVQVNPRKKEAGVQGLEPQLTEPESVVLPITPHPSLLNSARCYHRTGQAILVDLPSALRPGDFRLRSFHSPQVKLFQNSGQVSPLPSAPAIQEAILGHFPFQRPSTAGLLPVWTRYVA